MQAIFQPDVLTRLLYLFLSSLTATHPPNELLYAAASILQLGVSHEVESYSEYLGYKCPSFFRNELVYREYNNICRISSCVQMFFFWSNFSYRD